METTPTQLQAAGRRDRASLCRPFKREGGEYNVDPRASASAGI